MTNDALNSALAQKVRLRPDIQWSRFSTGSDTTWVARDPISLEYFHFSALEKSIACMLDGRRRLSDILTQHVSNAVSPGWLLQLITRLDDACLTVPRRLGGAGYSLWRKREARRRRGWLQRCLSPLAIRIKLFDPSWLLDRSALPARILFSKPFALTWLAIGLVVGYLVLNRFLHSPTSLMAALGELSGRRALGLAIAYLMVKSLHELGHALACKRWNAECHEIGILFLAFMPCLYCDTSDCWKLGNRWHRASIPAAGIYVELLLAVLAGGLWLLAPAQSTMHVLAANIMIVCSVSTIAVNANPLLRYDGYYVLADIWKVPNLADQAREALREILANWLTDNGPLRNRWDANAYHLAIYGFAAWLYRHFVICMIVWMVWVLLDRIGLPWVGLVLILTTLVGVVLGFYVGLQQWLRELFRIGRIRMLRFTLTFGCLVLAGLFFFLQPIPTFVSSRAVSAHAERTPVYAKQPGILVDFAPPERLLAAGETVAELASWQLQIELMNARGEVRLLEVRSEQLNLQSIHDDEATVELATVQEQLAKVRERLRILDDEHAALTIRAEQNGFLLSGPPFLPPLLTEDSNLQTSEPMLNATNTGCLVERGSLVGWLGQPGRFVLTAYVIENDAKLLRIGMPVRCRWDCDVDQLYAGQIQWISPEPIEVLPDSLRGDESIVTQSSATGEAIYPAQPHYAVDIELADAPSIIAENSLATVHFETRSRTCFQSVKRLLDVHIRPTL